MNHTSHHVCANIYRKALEEGNVADMKCCQCFEHEGCGDDQSIKWINDQLKRYRAEKAIIKAQTAPERDIDDEGYLKP